MARDQRPDFHVRDEFDKAHAAEAQRRTKGVEGVPAFAKLNPVHLHLLAWGGLEPYHRVQRQSRFEPVHVGTQLAAATRIAQHCDLPQQYGCEYPGGMRRRLPFPQVILKWRQLGGAQFVTLVPRPRVCFQVAAYGVDRASCLLGNLAQAHALLPQ
jgi:hypothetical protein